MSWNYRVVKWQEPGEEPLLKLAEVHYTSTGGLKDWAEPQPVLGTTFMELQEELQKMQTALRLPALDAKHFP